MDSEVDRDEEEDEDEYEEGSSTGKRRSLGGGGTPKKRQRVEVSALCYLQGVVLTFCRSRIERHEKSVKHMQND